MKRSPLTAPHFGSAASNIGTPNRSSTVGRDRCGSIILLFFAAYLPAVTSTSLDSSGGRCGPIRTRPSGNCRFFRNRTRASLAGRNAGLPPGTVGYGALLGPADAFGTLLQQLGCADADGRVHTVTMYETRTASVPG